VNETDDPIALARIAPEPIGLPKPRIYHSDETITLHEGDALTVLRDLPAGSVDCCVTSPPYYGLRDYGHPDQIGAEATPAAYVERLRLVFAEVRRVLADDGTLWLNIGDSYAGSWGAQGKTDQGLHGKVVSARAYGGGASQTGKIREGMPAAKNLMGVPWRVAFALQDDGWILRNAIVWNKPNAMPESVTDRLSTRYEMLFMFSKNRKYWFDLDPIREAPATSDRVYAVRDYAQADGSWAQGSGGTHRNSGRDGVGLNPAGRNPGDVWDIATTPFPGSHFAVFPPELPRRCIVAGCKPGGTVLDPFHGSGTTGMVAVRNGRRYVGIELNREYLDLSMRARLADGVLAFDE
jgi:site-specific DNA-methyltransferase (cytosine-N4-specific)